MNKQAKLNFKNGSPLKGAVFQLQYHMLFVQSEPVSAAMTAVAAAGSSAEVSSVEVSSAEEAA